MDIYYTSMSNIQVHSHFFGNKAYIGFGKRNNIIPYNSTSQGFYTLKTA